MFPSFVDAQSLCTCCDHSPEGSFRKAVSKSCVSLNASSESSLVVSMLSLHERVVIEVLRCRLGGSEFPSLRLDPCCASVHPGVLLLGQELSVFL